jgi:hypothetical protein
MGEEGLKGQDATFLRFPCLPGQVVFGLISAFLQLGEQLLDLR